jgi:putative flippase GtrA
MFNQIKALYVKHREIISYIFFGGLTTLVNFIVRVVCYYFETDVEISTTIGWIFAVTFAFFVNKIFVFRNKSAQKREWFRQAAQFYGARLLTYFLDLGFMIVTVRLLLWNELAMVMAVQLFILVANYVLSKFLIFRKPPPPN